MNIFMYGLIISFVLLYIFYEPFQIHIIHFLFGRIPLIMIKLTYLTTETDGVHLALKFWKPERNLLEVTQFMRFGFLVFPLLMFKDKDTIPFDSNFLKDNIIDGKN